jgi:hypothetical protein
MANRFRGGGSSSTLRPQVTVVFYRAPRLRRSEVDLNATKCAVHRRPLVFYRAPRLQRSEVDFERNEVRRAQAATRIFLPRLGRFARRLARLSCAPVPGTCMGSEL